MPCLAIVGLLASLTACEAPLDAAKQASPLPQFQTVDVHGGKLIGASVPRTHGAEVPSVIAFKGIRYAKAPIGDKRFKAPMALGPWTNALRATEFGPACPQPTNQDSFVWSRGDFEIDEDCLFLNLWTPASALDTAIPKEPQLTSQSDTPGRAVMVWFHGGSHTAGKGHEAIFDGTRLAQRDVIVVTVNYRLGVLGFLAHPALSDESSHASSGNYGLLDKIAALNWVRDNIAQFGGDPLNVTIFGQSAGSQSVCSLMASPLARGLFQKAIGQSAACTHPQAPTDANGHARGQQLVSALQAQQTESPAGSEDIATLLRAATPAELSAASNTSGWAEASRITVDGWVLAEPPARTFAKQAQAQVPLLVGSLANEGYLLFAEDTELTEANFVDFLADRYGAASAAPLMEAYAQDLGLSPGRAQWSMLTDEFMAFGMRRWAQLHTLGGNPAYLYFFDHTPPAFRLYVPTNPDLQLSEGPRSAGAYHSGDLAYVFNNTETVGLDWTPADHALADLIASYWTNFAKHGNPNGAGLPHWPRYDAQDHHTMRLSSDAQAVTGVRRPALDLLDSALPAT